MHATSCGKISLTPFMSQFLIWLFRYQGGKEFKSGSYSSINLVSSSVKPATSREASPAWNQHGHQPDRGEPSGAQVYNNYQTVLVLNSVKLSQGGLYTCAPSSGFPNATVHLHVVQGEIKIAFKVELEMKITKNFIIFHHNPSSIFIN